MANTIEYAVSKGFNKNIFIERDEAKINEYDVSKFGMEFFPGNEILIPGTPDVPPTPVGDFYLTFSSDSPFSISTTNESKSWDGTLECSTDTENWSEWDGTEVNSSEDGKLYFRGSNNSVISMADPDEWIINSWVLNGNAISCSGNIENLLDWQTIASGEHPQMGFGCYSAMFEGCSSLTTPPELSATTLEESCYGGMFSGCTSLTTAPELPAIILEESCYSGMFSDCTSLATPPTLPATTLAYSCYQGMFAGCASLTTPPELPATTLAGECYSGMFQGCTFFTTAPKLSATTLANQCYQGMFNGCTSLTTAPELPATTLAEVCYSNMFNGCTSIKLSTTQDSDYTIPYRIPTEGTGTDATGALNNMFANTSGTFTGTPTINTTYYLHKDNHIV